MTAVIHKFPVPIDGQEYHFEIEALDLTVLHVGVQATNPNALTLWAIMELDDDTKIKTTMKVVMRVIGTGQEYDNETWEAIGSAIVEPFVWHLLWREE